MAQTPEGKVKDLVKALLKQYGAYYFMPVQNGYGAAGLDFHCTYKGLSLYIETKAPGKQLTPRQLGTLSAVQAAGGAFFLVRNSDDLEAVQIWLERLHDRSDQPTA